MPFSDRVPSTAWAALTHKGKPIAEVWFKPDGDPLALLFRVPQGRADNAEVVRRLTPEALLRTVAVPADAVESCRIGDESAVDSGIDLTAPLAPLSPDTPYLTVHVRLKPTEPAAVVEHATPEPTPTDLPPEVWQDLEARWKAVLGLEAAIDALRLGMDGLRGELESANRRGMSMEEKANALQADVSQWTKAKSRVQFALPKLREFVHKATWATGVPARKRLEEVVRNHIEPRVPFADVDRVRDEIEHLLKDRQVLLAQGNAVQHEGRALAGELQRTFDSLRRNAANRAKGKKK